VTAHPLVDELALAMLIADRADAITMDRFNARDLVVETKPDLTPVSDADKAVEQMIRDLVAAERPDQGVLGEEFPELVGSSGLRWIVDPIDGTKNFVRGVPVWATILGLQDAEGRMVVGVVSAPALGRRWWATLGGGSWVREPGSPAPRRIHVSQVAALSDASLSCSDTQWVPPSCSRAGTRCATRSGATVRTATSGATCSSPRARSTSPPSPSSTSTTSRASPSW